MKTIEKTSTPANNLAKAANDRKQTSLNLDAATIAKLRAILRVTKEATSPEAYLDQYLGNLIEMEPSSGFFRDFIENKRSQTAAKERIARIVAGDKRLVRGEPLARNAAIYGHHLRRLETLCPEIPANSAVNSLLGHALDLIENGKIRLQSLGGEG